MPGHSRPVVTAPNLCLIILFMPHQIANAIISCVRVDSIRMAPRPSMADAGTNTSDLSYPGVCALCTSKRHHGIVIPELLQRQWGIGYEMAQRTIKVTTQMLMRHAVHPLRRRYRTDLMSLQYKRINETMYMNIMLLRYELYSKNTCAQLFTTKGGFAGAYPMKQRTNPDKPWTSLVATLESQTTSIATMQKRW